MSAGVPFAVDAALRGNAGRSAAAAASGEFRRPIAAGRRAPGPFAARGGAP